MDSRLRGNDTLSVTPVKTSEAFLQKQNVSVNTESIFVEQKKILYFVISLFLFF
jgi:hypothetical protein